MIADDFAETLVLVSLYKEMLAPSLLGPGVDPSTPEGKAAVATMVAQLQPDLDGQVNPAIADLLAGLAYMDTLDEATRQGLDLYPVWAAYDETRTYVTTWHPSGAAAWDVNGDWDALWSQVFAGGDRDPQFTHTVDLAAYIPEPASLALLGLGGLLVVRRRR